MNTTDYQDALTVTDLLARACTSKSQAPAVIYNDEVLSFTQLNEASQRVAGGLAALGVGPGDRVAFWLPNTPAYLITYFACARLGAIAIALNTRYRTSEVEDVLRRTRAKVLLMWPGFRGIDFLGLLESVDRAALETVDNAVLYAEGDPLPRTVPNIRNTTDFSTLLNHRAMHGNHARAMTGVNTFTTSGTTSAPKFVLHCNASIAVHAQEVARNFGHHASDTVVLQDLPLCGVFGFAGTMAAIAAQRPCVLTNAFDPQRSVELMARYQVTHFDGSDEMIHRLLEVCHDDALLARINFVGFAAFNSYLEDITERAEQRGLRLCGLWGMSEMQALVARRAIDAPALERKRAGGQLVSPQATARVRDPQSGELCPQGVTGELEITGPSQMLEYLENPQATAETLTDDGYVRTGDLATIEADGAFHYLTRMGDVLRLGGFLVSPTEIESQVQAHPSVKSVQVVAAPLDGADRAVAFVIPRDPASFDARHIQQHCRGRLAHYKVPAHVIALDAFPVTESANGIKIQRTRLRDMAIEHAQLDMAPSR